MRVTRRKRGTAHSDVFRGRPVSPVTAHLGARPGTDSEERGSPAQALQNLTDLERAEDLINNAYAELQAALSTVIIKASGAKFPDPLFDMQKKGAGLAPHQHARLLRLGGTGMTRGRYDS